jgi:hypothetical protein
MKPNALLLIAALTLSSFIVKAQNRYYDGGNRFGFRAGANISNMTFKTQGSSVSLSSLTGFNGAVFAEIPMGKTLFFQPEISFSQMGSILKSATSGEAADVRIRLNYIAVPILVKFTIPNTSLSIYAGPQVGVLVSANAKEAGVSEDNKDSYAPIDVAGVFGADYFLKMGLGFSARYQAGFTNVLDQSNATESGNNAKNHCFTLSLAYRFR